MNDTKIRIASLEQVFASDDEEAVHGAIISHLVAKNPLSELVDVARKTEWRFVLTRNDVEVARRDELKSWYQELVDQVADSIPALEAAERGGSPFARLEARDIAADYCETVTADATRLCRFLFPEDGFPNASDDIEKLLSRTGLKWDGAHTIEREPGEYDRLFQEAVNVLAAREANRNQRGAQFS